MEKIEFQKLLRLGWIVVYLSINGWYMLGLTRCCLPVGGIGVPIRDWHFDVWLCWELSSRPVLVLELVIPPTR